MKLILIDGSAYIMRAYFAMPALETTTGVPVGALHGFCEMILGIRQDPRLGITHLAVVGDRGRSGRTEALPSYKGQRSERPEDLLSQMKLCDRACEALGVANVSVPGMEADDVIAGLAEQFSASGNEVVIYSSDKDLMQLVGGSITQYCPMKQRHFAGNDVLEKWGVKPSRIADLLGLIGDTSDNLPGVRGIGPKIGSGLIRHHDNLEGVIAAAMEGRAKTTAKLQAAIVGQRDQARLSRDLARLKPDVVPANFDFTDLENEPLDARPLLEFFEEFEFEHLIGKIAA